MNRRLINLNIPDPEKHSYCKHVTKRDEYVSCDCGEISDLPLQWNWSQERSSSSCIISDGADLLFHPVYSTGTAIAVGDQQLVPGYQHYWEMKITRRVYGTDFMVGVTTRNFDLNAFDRQYSSVIGMNSESWGLSYLGYIQHNGVQKQYVGRREYGRHTRSHALRSAHLRRTNTGIFSIGSLVGIHLDTFRGTLEFYLNREPLGIAFTGLKNKELFPVVSSTTAKSGLKLICARSYPDSLQFRCLKQLSKKYSLENPFLPQLCLPPGMQQFVVNNFWFFFSSRGSPRKEIVVAEDIFDLESNSPARETKAEDNPTTCRQTNHHKRKMTSASESSDDEDFAVYTRSRKKELLKKATSSCLHENSETRCHRSSPTDKKSDVAGLLIGEGSGKAIDDRELCSHGCRALDSTRECRATNPDSDIGRGKNSVIRTSTESKQVEASGGQKKKFFLLSKK